MGKSISAGGEDIGKEMKNMKYIAIGSAYEWGAAWAKVGIQVIGEHFLTYPCHIEWLVEPISPLYFLKLVNLHWKLDRLRLSLKGPVTYTFGSSTLVNRLPLAPFHPLRQLPFFNSYFVAHNYWKLAFAKLPFWDQRSPRLDLLVFDCGGIGIFSLLASKAGLTVYRFSDSVAEFPNTSHGQMKCEEQVLREVDVVLAVSSALYEKAVTVRGHTEGVYLLPNGVKVDLFSEPAPEPPEYESIARPRAIFVGGLSEWVDWDLLLAAAQARPDTSFCIVGTGKCRPKYSPPNVYFLGARAHSALPSYLQYADVGLIPFRDMPLIRKIERPLKFYEYLASGLPVVTVPYGSMRVMNPPALLAETPDEFVRAIDKALGYTPDMRQQLRDEAQKYSWQNIFAQLDHILELHGFKFDS